MKKIRLGLFGLGRGSSFMDIVLANDGEVVALCERDEARMNKVVEGLSVKPACYTDFEEFLQHDMDAVFLCNCFHEHAPFAIRCLEKGLHVLTECTSNGTMAEGVALVRAAEKSKGIFMLAENYPFMQFNQEMRRVYRGGDLGKALFCEGEYNHPFNMDDTESHKNLRPYAAHWRNHLPRSYYITHSLAPLMYITGARPVRVSAFGCFAPFEEFDYVGSLVGDRAAIISCLNSDDSVFRVTGCAAFGAHENSYRVCGTKGQMENIRGGEGRVMLRYNSWEIPAGQEEQRCYIPEWPEDIRELVQSVGHGGGDFFVIREFFRCIREGCRPEFDEHFATTCASVGILAHRSLLEKGVPYDIPDFHREEDRVRYENDWQSPFPDESGKASLPCCSHPEYVPCAEQYENYKRMTGE